MNDVDADPYTLHPTPYTLHPTPYTLHYTRDYTLETILHPTPYILHPTPYTPVSLYTSTVGSGVRYIELIRKPIHKLDPKP